MVRPAIGPVAPNQRRHRLGRALSATRILRIGTLHGIVGKREVAGAARQRAEMIEACREREGARACQPPVSRLEAEQATERSRHADRAVGVGGERQRHQPARHRAGRAAGRAAGHAARIMRIARGAGMHVLAGEVVGVFAHVERAHQDGPGGFEPFDQNRIAGRGRPGLVDLGARQRRQARDVEQVLDRERNARQRSERLVVAAIAGRRPAPGRRRARR